MRKPTHEIVIEKMGVKSTLLPEMEWHWRILEIGKEKTYQDEWMEVAGDFTVEYRDAFRNAVRKAYELGLKFFDLNGVADEYDAERILLVNPNWQPPE